MGGWSVQDSVCKNDQRCVCVCVSTVLLCMIKHFSVHDYKSCHYCNSGVWTRVHVTRALLHQSTPKKHASEQISAYSASAAPCERTRVSHSRDDQRGGEEQSSQQAAPAVCVLPLALVHLSTAVVAAAAHAEEEPDDGHQNGEQQANRRTYQEADLVVDGLGVGGGATGRKTGWRSRIEKHVGGKNGKRRQTRQQEMKGESRWNNKRRGCRGVGSLRESRDDQESCNKVEERKTIID